MFHKKQISIILCVWSYLFVSIGMEAMESVKLFFIHSRDPSSAYSSIITTGTVQYLEEAGLQVRFRYAPNYYDLDELLPEKNINKKMLRLHLEKWKPDYIIVNSQKAANNLLEYDLDVLKKHKIIFCAIPGIPGDLDQMYPKSIFLLDKFPIKENIDLVLNIHPDLDRIVFIGTSHKQQNKSRFGKIRRLQNLYKDRVDFKIYYDTPISQIQEELLAANTKDAIIELKHLVNDIGEYVYVEQFYPSFQEKKALPIYTFWSPTRNYNVVGGKIFDESLKGLKAAECIIKDINKKDFQPEVIHLDASPYQFYWDELEKYNIDKKRLPDDSIIIGEPARMSKEQRLYFIGITLCALSAFITIFVLLLTIRKRKKTEADLANANRNLKMVNRQFKDLYKQKNDYISMVIHDLKNPISAINVTSSLLLDLEGEVDESAANEIAEYSSFIESSSEDMIERIDGFLKEEQLISELNTFSTQEFDLHFTIKDALEINRINADKKDIHIDIESSDDVILVIGDRIKIREVADNLISNAVKYSKKKSNICISWGLDPTDENYWFLSVRDSGPGFTEEDKSKIFQRYQQLSALPTGGESSTGLGLYITKKYIEQHNGDISLKSEYGKGATFTVRCRKN